jgi:hypothetical protein
MPFAERHTSGRKAAKSMMVEPIGHSHEPRLPRPKRGSVILAAFALLAVTTAETRAQQFIPNVIISSTIPPNGDLNPYGVAFVPPSFPTGGNTTSGDILVSNFNNSSNAQGTGTTITKLTPNGLVAPAVSVGQAGNATTFFQGSGLGLTTALGVLKRGFVLVGNVPTSNGTIQPGSLLLLDKNGKQLSNSPYISNLVNDPWDMAIDDQFDHALVFLSNVNNGPTKNKNGFVTRLNLAISATGVAVTNATVIAKGYTVEPNPAALVLGPTGLAYDAATDTLYVASTADNAIFAVSSAGSRTGSAGRGAVIFQDDHLRGPLALLFAPNGNLITTNGDAVNGDPTQPSEIVEFTKTGVFVGQFNVDAGQGGAFGMSVASADSNTVRLAVVDDNANDLIVFTQDVVR